MQFSDLFAAVVRRDVTAVEAALNDPVVGDRALAAAIHLPVSDEALTALIRTAPEIARRRCYGVLRRSRRRTLADSLLPEVVATFGEREGINLLAACSPSTVDSWLPRLAVTEAGLRSLVDVAPLAVANIISGRLWSYHLEQLVVRDSPAAALRLIELSGHAGHEVFVSALREPRALLELVRRQPCQFWLYSRPLPRAVLRALRLLTVAELAELADRVEHAKRYRPFDSDFETGAVDPLLSLLPPAERARLLAARHARVSPSQLAALAPADRTVDLLPLPAAEARLSEATHSHHHKVRQEAWPALLFAAQLHGDPAELARVFDGAVRAWHDRHPVRTAAINQACETPAKLLRAVTLETLAEVTEATVQALDSDFYTLHYLELWLRRTLQSAVATDDLERAEHVLRLMLKVVTHERHVDKTALRFPVATVVSRLDDATLTKWAVPLGELVAKEPAALALLGDRLLPRAIGLWLRVNPSRVAEVLASGAPEVVRLVATRRSELLPQLLPHLKSLHLVPARAPRRWNSVQREQWAAHVAAVIADTSLPRGVRAAAVHRVDDLSFLLALSANDTHVIAAAALVRLGAFASEQALDRLLDAANLPGARGRAAATGLGELMKRMSDDRILLLGERVGVGARKALTRALGRLGSVQARQWQLDLWDRADLHRDVRAVLAEQLMYRLGEPAVADRLLAGLADETVRYVLLEQFAPRLTSIASAHVTAFVTRALRQGDPAVVTAAVGHYRFTASPEQLPLLAELAHDRRLTPHIRRRCISLVSGSDALRPQLFARVAAEEPQQLIHLVGAVNRYSLNMGDDLAEALLTARLPHAAAQALQRTAAHALAAGIVDFGRWDRLLEVVGDRLHRLSAAGPSYERYPADDALQVAEHLRGKGTLAATLLAIGLCGQVSNADEPWRSWIRGWATSDDVDIAEAARLVSDKD